MQVSRKKILVLGTGGTIAGWAPDPSQAQHYQAAQVGLDVLLRDVHWPDGFEGVGRQLLQIDSKDMDAPSWCAILQACWAALRDPDVHGVVVTHGSDTLEETAYLLEACLPQDLRAQKPVVLTCAMRAANAPDADGPRNLQDAIRLAAWPGARGVLVQCAGEVFEALWVQKLHPRRLNAFSAGEQGALAQWQGSQSLQLHRPWPPTPVAQCSAAFLARLCLMTRDADWPWVEIVHSGAMARPSALQALLAAGVQGLVLVGTGNGTVHQALLPALQQASSAGVPVYLSTRCALGGIDENLAQSAQSTEWPAGASGMTPGVVPCALSPAKARIQLMLALLQQQVFG